jgi:peptide/nickel transport system ATP-binding protein/oligopeptide transport system ATP-binding protein
MMDQVMQVAGLRKNFKTPRGIVRAVDDVSFEVGSGETVALVGESGCGKSTVAMSLLRLLEPDAGTIIFDGTDLSDPGRAGIGKLRQRIGFVFQNPYSSLNPKMRIVDIIGEPLRMAGLRGAALAARVMEYLRDVGMGPEHLKRFPHEFSGGQRQRIAIARALAMEPKLMILDEPTAALDVSVQAQILNLLGEIQQHRNVSYLFISHDLAVVEHIADKVLVMYLGRIVEAGATHRVMAEPRHPYTRALLDSVPVPDPTQRHRMAVLSGEVPSPLNPPPGCPFAPRCKNALGICATVRPELAASPGTDPGNGDGGGRLSACHNPVQLVPAV